MRSARFRFLVALIIFMTSLFYSYRVRAARDALSFAPTASRKILVPAGTAVKAVIFSGIASSASLGDTVIASVSDPVVSEDTFAIRPGSQLKGTLEELSLDDHTGKAQINFTLLLIGGRTLPIQTHAVAVVLPVQGDAEILRTTFRILTGATFGAAVGAASQDVRLIRRGLFDGARLTIPVKDIVPITVILAGDLEV